MSVSLARPADVRHHIITLWQLPGQPSPLESVLAKLYVLQLSNAWLVCRDAGKAVKSLVAAGMVDSSPDSVAAWVREHQAVLDPTQIGEYLGSHEDLPVSR